MPSIFDLFRGKEAVRPEPKSQEAQSLVSFETELNKHKQHMSMLFNQGSCKKILGKIGGVQALYDLYDENEIIASAIDTRLQASQCAKMSIETESETLRDIIEQNIQPHLYDLISGIWWANAYGYSIVRLVWDEEALEQQGIFKLKSVYKRPCHKFQPLFNLRSCINVENSVMNPEPEVYGKYLVTTKDGCPDNPHGEALFCKLYYLHMARCQNLQFWIKCAEKFSYPFLYGKTQSGKVKALNQALEQARRGSSITTDKDTEIGILSANVNPDGFLKFEEVSRTRIYLAILGQNLTSEVKSGSLAAAQVHGQVKSDKIKSDLRMIEESLNYLAEMIMTLNGIEGQKVNIKLQLDNGLNKDRAERDQILFSSGAIKPTQKYIDRVYDFEEGDIEIRSDNIPSFNFDGPEHISLSDNSRTHTFAPELTKEQKELEDFAEFLVQEGDTAQNNEELLAAVKSSSTRKELQDNLAQLSLQDNDEFEEQLTRLLYWAFSKGVSTDA